MKNKLYLFCAALLLAATFSAYGQTEPSKDEDGTYLIGTADELVWFRNLVNASVSKDDDSSDEVKNKNEFNVKLTADIDLSGIGNWVPIGTYHGEPDILYYGTFDGQEHVIKGLTVNPIPGREGSYGLFGIVNGTVKNLGIEGGTVTGGDYVGAICGMLSYGTIENCFSTATVTGNGDAGGLTGGMRKTSRVVNSYNAGKVTSTGETALVGGITSYIGSEALVKNCYNAGQVSATAEDAQVGAIAGDDYSDETSLATKSGEEEAGIINCFYLEGTGNGSKATALSASDFVATINANLFSDSSEDAPWKGEAQIVGGEMQLPTFTEGEYSEVEVETYAVTLDQSEGGTISADKERAAEGETVVLTATPEDDYEFDGWSVKDATGADVVVSGNTFVMPASEVTVVARFTYVPPYVPSYYDLYFEANDSVQFSSDKTTVVEGSSMTFTAEVLEGYDPATLVVEYKRGRSGQWKALKPNASGKYRVSNVYTNIYVRASVQPLDDPTSVDEISGTESTVRAIGGRIIVTVSKPLEVRVVSMVGQVVRVVRLSDGQNEIAGLPEGIYIVMLSDGTRAKVLLR